VIATLILAVVLYAVIILNNQLGQLVGDLFLVTGFACPKILIDRSFG
jgi:hypothetical protein